MTRRASVLVLGAFGLAAATLIVGSLIDGSGADVNYQAQLIWSERGWRCRLTAFNANPGKHVNLDLRDIKLGASECAAPAPTTIPVGATVTFDFDFPASAAASGKIATLSFWAKRSGFAYASSTLVTRDVVASKLLKQFVDLGPPRGDPQSPFLTIRRSRDGWVCRYTYRNASSANLDFLVARCWLNGREAVHYPGSWIVQPGETVALDVLFSPEAAQDGKPAEFHGYYQVSRPHGDSFRLREIRETLQPR